MRIRQLEILSVIVIALSVADGLSSLAFLCWEALHSASYLEYAAPHRDRIDLGAALFGIITAVVFSCWIYVAGTNVVERGHADLQFSPASRIWWFLVPVLGLFKPFEAMRELWNVSHGERQYDRNTTVVTIWWTLWLGSALAGIGAGVFDGLQEDGFDDFQNGGDALLWWIDAVVLAALYAAAIVLVRRITVAQAQPHTTRFEEIFA